MLGGYRFVLSHLQEPRDLLRVILPMDILVQMSRSELLRESQTGHETAFQGYSEGCQRNLRHKKEVVLKKHTLSIKIVVKTPFRSIYARVAYDVVGSRSPPTARWFHLIRL